MRWTSKIFMHQKPGCAAAGCLFVVPFAAMLFFITLGMSGFELLYNLIRFQYLIDFAWVILTVIFVSRAEAGDLRECLDSCTAKSFTYERAAFGWILFLCLLWNVIGTAVILCGSFRNDATSYFAGWFIKSYIVNIILPQLICIFAAACFCISSYRAISMCMLLIFLFMISPFSELIVWKTSQNNPISYVWTTVHKFFEVFYQNSEWSPDSQYGFQTEGYRIQLEIAWLLVFVGFSFFKLRKKYGMAIVCAALGMFAVSFLPASDYRLTENYDGAFADREQYLDSLMDLQQYESNWNVTDYDMKICMNRLLQAEVCLTLKAEKNTESFLFTLYHGYDVDQVQSMTKGIMVSFSQDGDRLLVQTDIAVKELQIVIKYSGYCSRFYSNSEACMLPGWFPWYPMAGEHQIFGKYSDFGNAYGYNPYNRINKAHILLKTNYDVITNLSKKDTNTYEGMADNITLLAGNLLCLSDSSSVKDVLPLTLYAGTLPEENARTIYNRVDLAISLLEQYTGKDYSDLRLKEILVASKDLGRNYFNNDVAIFSDCILVAEGYTNANELFRYFLLQDRSKAKVRKESAIISACLIQQYLEEDPDNTLRSLITGITFMMQNNAEEETQIMQKFLVLAQNYLDAGKSMDFFRVLFTYESEPDIYGSDEMFLESIDKKETM